MRTLFVHDHRFKVKDGVVFSNGAFPSSIWSRYANVFGDLTVVGRNGGPLSSAEENYTISSFGNVRFQLLPNVSNVRDFLFCNYHVRDLVRNLVSGHDFFIARLPSRLGSMFLKEVIRQEKNFAIEIVGCPWDSLWNYGGVIGKLFAPYAALELKRIARVSKFALYVTEGFLQSRYPVNGKAIATFCSNVEVPKVDRKVLLDRFKRIVGRTADRPLVFGLIANYSSRYKGIDVAIKALKASGVPRWDLRVLGNGDPSEYIRLAEELGVERMVNFVGSLPAGSPVFDWIDDIDIYLQPSLTEGLPRALIEVMSRGVPALASDVGGIPELLSDAELSGAGDYIELAKKIEVLASDVGLQCKLADENFNKACFYYKDVLDERRAVFWKRVFDEVSS